MLCWMLDIRWVTSVEHFGTYSWEQEKTSLEFAYLSCRLAGCLPISVGFFEFIHISFLCLFLDLYINVLLILIYLYSWQKITFCIYNTFCLLPILPILKWFGLVKFQLWIGLIKWSTSQLKKYLQISFQGWAWGHQSCGCLLLYRILVFSVWSCS